MPSQSIYHNRHGHSILLGIKDFQSNSYGEGRHQKNCKDYFWPFRIKLQCLSNSEMRLRRSKGEMTQP